jgi:hypothetical protein
MQNMKTLRESLVPSSVRVTIILLLAFLLTSCSAVHDSSYQAHVWEDKNGNGLQDKGESDLQGITVQIIDPTNGLLWRRSITDTSGNIDEFSAGGTCGQYLLVLSVPEGYWPITPVYAKTLNCEIAQFGLRKNQ